MTGKRKAPLELALRYDERLTGVTRALENLKRLDDEGDDDDALASGAFDAFPLPGLRLSGDAADLPLPLTPLAVDAIALRATNSTTDHVLVVSHQDVELRNPHWEGFLVKIMDSIRAPLDITEAAELNATLKQVVLVRPGGQLPLPKDDSAVVRKHGRFGSLVVVLPGEFSGGEVTITKGASSTARGQTQQWNPERTDRDAYGLGYAAFYNDVSAVKIAPVTSGDALCLVYDLVTTTIHELRPRYAGAQVLKDQVQTALTNFFMVPPPLMKRTKITQDAWRIINEFTTDHRLIYPIMASSFDELDGEEKQLFEHLVTFCDSTNGQYALYLASMGGCSWDKPRSKDTIYRFSLRSPWCRHGDDTELPFATKEIRPCLEIGPAGFMERVQHRKSQSGYAHEIDEDDPDDLYQPFHCFFYVGGDTVCTLRQSFALVVQPKTLEDVLWAEVRTDKLLDRLNEMVTTSPTEAVRIARRFLARKSDWTSTDEHFAQLLEVTLTLNDADLFCDLLRTTTEFVFDDTMIPRAVRCFGWDSCVAAIEKRIETLTSFRSRVNLICSVLHDSSTPDQIDRLIHKLIPLLPWSGHDTLDCKVDLYLESREEDPSIEEFRRLLRLTRQSSPATLQALLEKTNASSLTILTVIPSLTQVVEGLSRPERTPLVPTLQSLRAMIESSLPVLRNAYYARCTVQNHCDKCSEIQSFLVSTAQQISLTIKNKAQRKHVETVVKRQIHGDHVAVETTTPTTVQLTKRRLSNLFLEKAERTLVLLSGLINPEPSPAPTQSRRSSKRRARPSE